MRGIVVGEVIRGWVARTVAHQLCPAVEAATSPFQCALLTKSGCECVAHCIQALCETDKQLTLTSVDGVSAFASSPDGNDGRDAVQEHLVFTCFISICALTKTGCPTGTPRTRIPWRCSGMSEPRHTLAERFETSPMRCKASHTGGSIPAAFHPTVDPNVGMPKKFLL